MTELVGRSRDWGHVWPNASEGMLALRDAGSSSSSSSELSSESAAGGGDSDDKTLLEISVQSVARSKRVNKPPTLATKRAKK